MKLKTLFLLFTVLCFQLASAQIINNVDHVYTRQTGAIKDGNKIIGYYVVANSDKKVKGKEVFSYTILDAGLKTTSTLDIEKEKNTVAAEVVYNGSHVCIEFINTSDKTLECVVLNVQGKMSGTYTATVLPDEFKEYKTMFSGYSFPQAPGFLQALPGKGFVRYGITDADGRRINMEAFDNDGKFLWKSDSQIKAEKLYEMVLFSHAEEQVLFTYLTTMENARMKNKTCVLIMQDAVTGKHITTVPTELESFTTNVHGITYNATNKEFVIYGVYGIGIDASNDNYRKGFYFQTLTAEGKITTQKRLSWDEDMAKLLPEKAFKTSLVGGAFYLHELIPVGDGYVLIGERFLQRLKIGVGVMAGTGGVSTGPSASLDLESHNVFAFQIKSDFTAEKAHTLPKEVHEVNQTYVFNYSTMMMFEMGYKMKQLQFFDYINCTVDGNSYTCTYQDIDKIKNKSTKLFIRKTTFPADKTASQDLLSESSSYRLFPTESGGLIIEEFNRKENTIKFSKL